ncbi:MAG TPA: hypothetical protein PKD16_18010 [Saprospiraceae bacterium]|jgi:hypothetical protein|nr:hypothetical protein [Saprospiraceae bacterium]
MKNILLIITAILLVSCSHKQTPQITIPTTYDKCDTAIQQILDSIKAVKPKVITRTVTVPSIKVVKDTIIDSSDCNYYKVQALELLAKLHTANKETEYYKVLAQSRAKKIINNINSGNKNTQIGDANTQQIKPKATAVIGNDNVTTVKPKQSAVGDGNDLDNSKKGTSWIWIFIAGNLCWLILQNLLYPLAMRFIPFANLTSNIGKGLLKLKFW